MNKNKVVVFSGAGISQESGLPCFTGSGGLWDDYDINDVCTRSGFDSNPELVTKFYNTLKNKILKAKPNSAHIAIAELEKHFDVTVVTTNVDDLHERAGSSNVIHVHGNMLYGKSHFHQDNKVFVGEKLIEYGEMFDNFQLRHDIVFYGEMPENLELAKSEIKEASKLLVVGSSLSVSPSNALVKRARFKAEKAIVNVVPTKVAYGFRSYVGLATEVVPQLVTKWISEKK